jgi:hypothetical protein
MLSAVEFHDQACFRTDEINDLTVDFVLVAEFAAHQMSIAQMAP